MNRNTILTVLSVLLLVIQASRGQTYPPGFTGTDLASGLSSPTCFCIAQDGTIYICQQGGTMRVWKESVGLLPTQFFVNNPLTVNSSGERGLIGVTVDPDFMFNRFIYVYYTATTPAVHNRISRFTASANGELALAGSEAILLDLNNLSATNHNGGGIHFGPDGKLYAGVGENAFSSNAQNINNLLGKMLRINPTPGNIIPADNPTSFPGIAGTTTGDNRAIWAVGLRNPFTHAFQPGTGRLFINDVGQSAWEEVNDGIVGRNYGWPTTEGPFNQASFPNFTHPFYWYSNGSAICGGAFYNPPVSTYPVAPPASSSYYGDYFFGELSGRIDRVDVSSATATAFATSTSNTVDTHVDSLGRLVYLMISPGRLVRVSYNNPFAPSVMTQPVRRDACTGDTVEFSVNIAGNPAPTITWRRDGIDLSDGGNISGAATNKLTISAVQPGDAGNIDAFIQNSQGSASSDSVQLHVYPDIILDGSQIQPFVDASLASSTSLPQMCWFDFDGNSVVNPADVDGFVAALLGL